MHHGADAPQDDRNGETDLRAELVHESPGEDEADGIGSRKREDDPAVIDVRPAKYCRQCRLEYGDDLTIDIVDG